MYFSDKNRQEKTLAFCLRTVFFVTFVFVGLTSAFGVTLEKYKENIQHLKDDFLQLANDTVEEDFLTEVSEELTELLPDEDTIEFEGVKLEVNNKWVSGEITRYKALTDGQDKRLVFKAIYERLDAIELKINELEKAVAKDITKDELKRKLAEILKREEFQKAVEEESLVQRFLTWLEELMKRNAPVDQPKPLPTTDFGQFARVLQFLLYGLVAVIIGFLILKFGPFFVKKFRDREKREKKERKILGEKISTDETSANLFSEAENLAREGNLRDAIRKGYIAFLFELSERKLIGLAKHKTNRDYLRSVKNKHELHKNMNGLTSNYERHWYGFQDAEETDWEEFRTSYNKALNKN